MKSHSVLLDIYKDVIYMSNITSQYREDRFTGFLCGAMWHSMFIHKVHWLEPASSAVSLAGKCNKLAAMMVISCQIT